MSDNHTSWSGGARSHQNPRFHRNMANNPYSRNPYPQKSSRNSTTDTLPPTQTNPVPHRQPSWGGPSPSTQGSEHAQSVRAESETPKADEDDGGGWVSGWDTLEEPKKKQSRSGGNNEVRKFPVASISLRPVKEHLRARIPYRTEPFVEGVSLLFKFCTR